MFHEVNYLASCGKAKKIEKVRVMNANKKTQSPLPSPTAFYLTPGIPLSLSGTRAINKQP